MKDPERPGERIAVVQVLETLAILEVIGGAILLFAAQKSELNFAGGLIPSETQTHDWVSGAVYLAAAVFVAALLFGFAHIVQDLPT